MVKLLDKKALYVIWSSDMIVSKAGLSELTATDNINEINDIVMSDWGLKFSRFSSSAGISSERLHNNVIFLQIVDQIRCRIKGSKDGSGYWKEIVKDFLFFLFVTLAKKV